MAMDVKVTSTKILIVEGFHEKAFFSKLMEQNNISGIQILPICGKTQLSGYLRMVIKDPLFAAVTSIGITRDADDNFADAFKAIQAILQNLGLPVPSKPIEKTLTVPSVSIYILPDNSKPGALENLCLDSVKSFPTYECVTEYMDCLEKIQGHHPHYSKAAVQVFLAKEPEGDVSMSTASNMNVWPWACDSYKSVLEFIKNI